LYCRIKSYVDFLNVLVYLNFDTVVDDVRTASGVCRVY
jgi:hypothetical protein